MLPGGPHALKDLHGLAQKPFLSTKATFRRGFHAVSMAFGMVLKALKA